MINQIMTTSLELSLGVLDLLDSRCGLCPPAAAQHLLRRQHVHFCALLLEELFVPVVVPCILLSARIQEFKAFGKQRTTVRIQRISMNS